MIIVNSLRKKINIEGKELSYSYNLIKTSKGGQEVYGIEVERADYINDIAINVEKNSVNIISPNEDKVRVLLEKLYRYEVSPIHLIDIIGEDVDKCVNDFDKVFCMS
ncbi:DUF6514 family protein [Clostridium fallax]|uniref:Uncharacterized protein n=1 Tax=Clostridium fallax TaxID=1533 RepID=A0A1M4VN15_9CLOT|nr:DUF6514 family protein [Clostridium fallax]SHE70253.1 hypothetical protein SAMN05443638_10858 [Clostridium fallax]SQB22800.1 Uncharacterised protein [Clostridium fallax]